MKFKDVPKDKIHKIADSAIAGLNDLGHDYNCCKTTENPEDDEEAIMKFEGNGLEPAELNITASFLKVMDANVLANSLVSGIDELIKKSKQNEGEV